MTVIAHDLETDDRFAFTKGAPEALIELCDKNSFPKNYDSRLEKYTK
jgi:hypothetical protein